MTTFFASLLAITLIIGVGYQYRRRAPVSTGNRRLGASMFNQERLLRRSLNRDTPPPQRNDTIYL